MSIRSALLQLLDEGERHGYQLKADFEARSGGIWPLNVGQVYSTLDRLLRDGLVAEVEAPATAASGQRTYRITEDGRGEVKRWLAASPVDTDPPRDELIMKVLLAVGRGSEDAVALIDEQRTALLAALQMGRRRLRAEADLSTAARLARDAVLTRVEADIGWLDRCEEQVRATRRREADDTEGTR